jgi:hypothetical protein
MAGAPGEGEGRTISGGGEAFAQIYHRRRVPLGTDADDATLIERVELATA